MDENAAARRPSVQLALLLICLGLGARFVQIGLGEPPPAEAARGGGHDLWRVAWLDDCGLPGAVGLYTTTDPVCQPGRAAPLSWLQGQLTATRLLARGEYLMASPHPAAAACRAQVLTPDGAPAGWLCADSLGLYRLNLAGDESSGRWQMWPDGQWVEVGA